MCFSTLQLASQGEGMHTYTHWLNFISGGSREIGVR